MSKIQNLKSKIESGLLVIDKPAGLTSHDVVGRVRRILGTRRVGHTGTLDPFATGVLVVLVGRATRLAQFLDKDSKSYEAVVRFGFETDTGDLTGARTGDGTAGVPTIEAVNAVVPDFTGEIEQVPPMFSAKKIAGRKLYELAREGIELERKAARVRIESLEFFVPGSGAADELGMRVTCSAGTYIRTLAADIARAAGSAAHLKELRRTAAGRFGIGSAVTLEELADAPEPAGRLVPMAEAVAHLPEIRLGAERVAKTLNGMSSRIPAPGIEDGAQVRITGPDGELVAIGEYGLAEETVRPRLVLV